MEVMPIPPKEPLGIEIHFINFAGFFVEKQKVFPIAL
jgi:hypothetical protein